MPIGMKVNWNFCLLFAFSESSLLMFMGGTGLTCLHVISGGVWLTWKCVTTSSKRSADHCITASKKSTEGSRNWARHLVYVVSVPGSVVGSLLYRLCTASSPPINTKISSSGTVTSLTLARVQEQRRTFWSIQSTLETTKTILSLLIIMVMKPFLIQYLTHTHILPFVDDYSGGSSYQY